MPDFNFQDATTTTITRELNGNTQGDWALIDLSGNPDWVNVGDAFSDPTLPALATQGIAGTGLVQIRGHLGITLDLAGGATDAIGRITLPGVIPEDQRPATLSADVAAHFAVLVTFDPLVLITLPVLAFVTSGGDIVWEVGTCLPDATTFADLFAGDWSTAVLPTGITALVVDGLYSLT